VAQVRSHHNNMFVHHYPTKEDPIEIALYRAVILQQMTVGVCLCIDTDVI